MSCLAASGQDWAAPQWHTAVPSTQAALRLDFAEHPPRDLQWRMLGTDHQTAGHGRNQATWHAAAGHAVLVSFGGPLLLAPELWPRLSLVAGLAVREVLTGHCPANLQLKWPNDIVVRTEDGWHKLAGLLCERVGGPCADPLWLCGVGVNVTAVPAHPGLAMPAVSLGQLGAPPELKRQELAAELAVAVRTAVVACQRAGGTLPIARLEQHLAFLGTAVTVDLGLQQGQRALQLQGLDSGGELRGRWVTDRGEPGAYASVSPLHLAAAPGAGWPGPQRAHGSADV